jgi:YHYH protein/Secretion system C-terminal sorting domain
MKRQLLLSLLLLPILGQSQAILTKWQFNVNNTKATYWAQTGTAGAPVYTFTTSPDLADVLQACYSTDYVWIKSNGLTTNMGRYANPGTCLKQNYVHRFPRKPTVPTTKSISPKGGQIGLLLNGIPIFGLGNASSWNGSTNAMGPQGSGIWNVEVYRAEGFTLDTAFGAHPQQQGAYHTHATPFRLYKNTPTTQHSPIIGFAFDGYPVYGPYGYSNPNSATSTITRMKTGYALRNITDRTKLPYNVTPTQVGPPINNTYPLGAYCEDYEWSSANGGDLDKYNGRFCVTPDYPEGTYAYFVTISAAGVPQFPYIIGIEYYGAPETGNFPIPGSSVGSYTMPTSGVTCATSTITSARTVRDLPLKISPNPTFGYIDIQIEPNFNFDTELTVYDMMGRKKLIQILRGGNVSLNLSHLNAGTYIVELKQGEKIGREKIVKL